MRTWVVAIVVAVMVAGCGQRQDSFACTDDASCGAGGKCEPSFKLCSFLNEAKCGPGGRAFGDLGGANSGQCVNGTPPPDGGIDSPPDARACFGTGLVQFCLASAPTQPFTTTDLTTIDTGDTSPDSKCAPLASVASGGTYCVVAATNIILNGTLRATGAKPLVLLSTGSIATGTSAVIDVGSHRVRAIGSPETGAGADPASACAGGTSPTNGGGGAGGSFTGLGGNGGNGNNMVNTGGSPVSVATAITELRGGCAGQDGQGGIGERGVRGHGGGAVFLIALDRIDIEGGIDAGGEGGAAGITNSSGAGGGGAGGMIGFDAPRITVTSLLLANGGAGGEGSGQATPGKDGADATDTTAAKGGAGNTGNGGDGGNGSAGAAAGAGGPGNTGSSGGGGGGGGAGIIKAPNGASLGNMVSPAATQP